MPNAFKLSGAKATGWFKDRFRLSLFKLTALYLLILAVILVLSSSTIYKAFSNRLEFRFRNFGPGFRRDIDTPSAPNKEDVRRDLINSVVVVNGMLLVLAGILSYGLALWTLKPLREAFENQRRFLGDASHELRTPLSILKTDMENELTGASGAARQQIESNLEEVERMSRLVSDLLVLSRLDETASAISKNISSVNLNSLIEETVERFNALAKEHQVSVKLTAEREIILNTDENLLSQALTNVIKNSILYNKQQGSTEIKLKPEAAKVKIIVSDTGIGIDKKDLKRIFDRFYRADKSRSRQTGGSGLGLSIARSSVEKLGGAIHAESEPEKGATIIIELPIS